MLFIINKRFAFIFIFLIAFCSEVIANEKVKVDGDTLYYSTFQAKQAINREINWDDTEVFEDILKDNPNITLVQIDSSGGLVEAAIYLADIIIDYELNTHIDGECASSCVLIFLGGEKRSLARGSWIGFHKTAWASEDLKDYYMDWKEDEEWTSEFDFAEWLYEDTQKSVLRDLEYLIERGVEPGFAIKTLRADSDDMWYPRRKEMEAAGIITED